MDNLLKDLRLAVRGLVGNPVFTLVAVACLGLGIGSASAIYSIVDAVLFAPLPYDEPERVVLVNGRFEQQGLDGLPASRPEFEDWHELSESFEALGAVGFRPVNLTGGEEPERLLAVLVSEEAFAVFGARAARGRLFQSEDHRVASAPTAVLGHDFWRQRYGERDLWADGDADDRLVRLEDSPTELIGVMEEDFRLGSMQVDLWLPMPSDPPRFPPRNARFLTVYGRLAPDVSLDQARAEMETVAAAMVRESPDAYADTGWGMSLSPVQEVLVSDIQTILWVLAAAVGLVLLIACVNVANLLLARGSSRAKEVAIRSALGASRGRVVRQLLTESLVLALAGAGVGLLLAWWLVEVLKGVDPGALPRLDTVGVDPTVVAFTVGVALVTGLVFGLLPALRLSRTDLRDTLQAGGKTSGGDTGGGRLRSALVVLEVAVAMVVLVGAGLVVKSFDTLLDQQLGYDTEQVVTLELTLSRQKYPEDFQVTGFFRGLEERLDAVPGVREAALVSSMPAGGSLFTGEVIPEGVEPPPAGFPSAGWRFVGPDYFQTLGIPLLAGRDFRFSDDEEATEVAILDQSLAERLWGDENPIGQRVRIESPRPTENGWRRVVGVVGTVVQNPLESHEEGQIYLPYAQYPVRILAVAARVEGDPASSLRPLRETIQDYDPDQPVENAQTLEERVSEALSRPRLTTVLFGLFAAVGLILAVVGVYGVLAYGVSQRTRELGVRLALGAERREILALVLGRGLLLAGLGLAIGAAVALALNRTVSGFLYGVSSTDPMTYVVVAGVLALAAVVASLVPAWRATRVDPVIALKAE